ncbi:hypothetical protein Leryth_003544 [Lithospermum erythrorhizon]|nr:hypothetical protein Leryth_003544 [Lithospermum erythrorhizon]
MLHRIVSEPYYLVNLLVFFSYIPIRLSASHVLVPSRSSLLLHREIQAVLTFLVLAAIKLVKSETWEAFTADFLFYAKVFLAAVALILDYHLALWYALAFLAIYILVQQPPYNKQGTSSQLTPLQLESLLTEGTTSKFWLVEFCALSTPECISTSSFFPELSITQVLPLDIYRHVHQTIFCFQIYIRTNFYLLEPLILDSSPMQQRSLVYLLQA